MNRITARATKITAPTKRGAYSESPVMNPDDHFPAGAEETAQIYKYHHQRGSEAYPLRCADQAEQHHQASLHAGKADASDKEADAQNWNRVR